MELGAAETRQEPQPPETPALAHFLAGTLAMNGATRRRRRAQFEKAVAADPHSAMLRQRLAAIYVRQGRLSDALEQMPGGGAVIEPDDAESRLMLADVLSTHGTRRRRDPRIRDRPRARSQPRAGAPAARRAVRQARRVRPRHRDPAVSDRPGRATRSSATTTSGASTRGAGLQARRAGVSQTALRINPQSEPVLIDLALLYEASQRTDEAIQLYEQVLKANPRRTNIRRRLGGLYARQRKFDDALGAVPRAAEGRHRRAGHAHEDRPHPARDRRVRARRQRVQPGARRRSRTTPACATTSRRSTSRAATSTAPSRNTSASRPITNGTATAQRVIAHL